MIDKEEKFRNVNNHDSIAEKIIDCLPQKPFNTNATLILSKDMVKMNHLIYICWNMIGTISIKDDENLRFIDINFAELTNKKKLVFLDKNNLSLGIMNNCGVLLASQLEEENMDEYEKEDKAKNAILQFKTIHNWGKYKDWSVILPDKEVRELF